MVMLLVTLLIPLARTLSAGQRSPDNDADRMILPILEMLDQSPQVNAQTEVEPILEIEEVWAIEDTRKEIGGGSLILGMRNGEDELGYDAGTQTFYCTLGLNGGDDWPELTLYAQGAEGIGNLHVVWVDDYTYDDRSEAIREGYRYELLAYTDTEYAYIGVVFTGLPIVTLHVYGGEEALGESYTPARVSVSSAQHDALHAGAWVHLRGGGSVKPIDKKSYRVEFHMLSSKGDEKAEISVLGMPADTDWLLIGNAQESTAIRNHLCWQMWRMWNEGTNVPAQLESRMVELFVDDAYMGLYQVLERIDLREELVQLGGNLQTDTVARIIVGVNVGEYPVLNRKEEANLWIEHRYEAGNRYERTFSRMEDYIRLMTTGENSLPDEVFEQLAAQRIDVRGLISYFLFLQACGLGTDNIFNNLYVWTVNREGGYVYYVSPWDMDLSLAIPAEGKEAESGESLELSFSLPCRMLDLDVNHCREMMWEIWTQKRATILSDEAIYTWIMNTTEEIENSGAYGRETEKWYGEAASLQGASLLYYTEARVENVENALRTIWPAENMPEQ